MRPPVVARKKWGGNRTDKGARAQAVLSSILATAQQQGKNPLEVLIELLVSPDKRTILALVPYCRERTRAPTPQRQAAAFHLGRLASQAERTLASEAVVVAALQGRSATVPVHP